MQEYPSMKYNLFSLFSHYRRDNMNPIDLIRGYMTNGMSLKGVVKNMIGNNPTLNNLANMVESGDNKSAEAFVRSVLKQRGLDYDKEMSTLKQKLSL